MIDQGKIQYKIKNSRRAKRVRIAVFCDGSVVVTHPVWMGSGVAEKFLHDKIEWVRRSLAKFTSLPEPVLPKSCDYDFQKYKFQAMSLVKDRIEFYNQKLNVKFNQIHIRRQKSRWGSCSRKGNLNFNYKIVFLKPQLADYLIVHELCHLKEFNHPPKFWELVEDIIPEYEKFRRELRIFSAGR